MFQLNISGHIELHNQKEFLQSVNFLMAKVKPPLAKYTIARDVNMDTMYHIIQVWNSRGDIDRYIRSENYSALLGAFEVLGRINIESLYQISESENLLE